MARRHQSIGLESCTAYMVCSFLDPCSLCLAEVAGWDRHCITACWMDLRAAAERQFASRPRWRKPRNQSVLSANPKQALHQLNNQLKTLADVPQSWGEYIRKRHETVIDMRPWLPTSETSQLHSPRPPRIAAVPLACGTARGETMSVGVRLQSKNLADVGEAFLLSSETLTYRHSQALVTAILFSPVSGKVFIRFPTCTEGFVAQCMPALTATSDATALEPLESDSIEAFVFVNKAGNTCFGRRRCPLVGCDAGVVEWSGELLDVCPPLSEELFFSLNFQTDMLQRPAQVSIMWATELLPSSVAQPLPLPMFNGAWCQHQW